jgi:hypothetical protein
MFILVKEAPFGSASEVIEDEDAEEGLKSGKYVSGGSRVVREVSAHSHSKIVNEDKSEHETHYKRKDERAEISTSMRSQATRSLNLMTMILS